METGKMLLMIPGPTNTPERIMKAMERPIINHRGPAFHSLYKSILENLKYAFQTVNDVFPLTASGTGGVECAVGNIIAPGDKIITAHFGVFGERLREAAVRFGGKPIDVSAEWGEAPSLERVKEALDENPDVKAIATVYNETSTGVTWRVIQELGKLSRQHDKVFIVDAISVLAGDRLPVDEWNVDICIAGSQKCLACPPGVSMVSVSERAYQVLRENKYRPFYFDLESCRRFAYDRMETPFTPTLTLFYGLDEALKFLKEEGLENRIERHRICAEAFYEAFDRAGLETLSKGGNRSNTVIALWNPPGIDGEEMRKMAREEHGVAIGGGMGKLKGKCFRIGSMGIICQPYVSRTLKAVFNGLAKLGYSFPEEPSKIIADVEAKLADRLSKLPPLRL
ncbi:MAG: aminotransferase [Candidatus Hecatellales archaeon]|nr:MAG: aminotransferase [Candidatus Hecatellales archaeon]